jgi:hypothetical protein
MIERVGFSAEVPGNVSRYFSSREEARIQPTGQIDLAWDSTNPYIFNQAFDSGIVRHDDEYCTSSVSLNGHPRLPTIEYFEADVLPHLVQHPKIVDIGCGQGEFVRWLRARGLKAVGYDPVLRESAPFLRQRYWSSTEPAADLFVMRCVLPHIADPWAFLSEVASVGRDALVLVEYQRLEFILKNHLWFQVSHDHVNQFRLVDFLSRYDVIGHGIFSRGEWQWVLLRPSTVRHPYASPCDLSRPFERLAHARHHFIESLARVEAPLAVWGAAGKGVVMAHALNAAGCNQLVMIDADPAKSGLYVEATGFPVIGPREALRELSPTTKVVVANPNHLAEVTRHIGDALSVSASSHWGQPSLHLGADRALGEDLPGA